MPPLSRHRRRLALVGIPALGLALGAAMVPAVGEEPAAPDPDSFTWSFQGEGAERVDTADFREGTVAPTSAQRSAAAALGATTVRWNQFGTPKVLLNTKGYLSGTRSGKAATVARAFVADHAGLFRLDSSGVDALEVLADSPLLESPDLARQSRGQQVPTGNVPHVVTLRQTFDGPAGELVAGNDGLLTIGVQRDGRVAYVSSSITGDEAVSGSQTVSAATAIQKAADDIGVDLGTLSATDAAGPWTTFASTTTRDVQRARLMAVPTPSDGTRLAWETTVLASDHSGSDGPTAFISFVDAQTGAVLLRDNRVDHLAQGLSLPAATPTGEQFTGSTAAAGGCTPQPHGPYAVDEGNGQIQVAAAATAPGGDDDITINLYRDGQSDPVASQDLLGSPEVLTYSPAGGVPAGDYFVEICEFTPSPASIGYTGVFAAGPGGTSGTALPRWREFESNPHFTDSATPDADVRELWCWVDDNAACDEQQRNLASRLPWDVLAPSIPTFTTIGNNASTSISEVDFQAPDAVVERPVSPERSYDFPWQNTWFNSSCDPTSFDNVANGRNDDDASVSNLFVSHNRMHDWSYFLGFTEQNSNMQVSNFGNTAPNRENDPEIGNAQAGRRTFNGRDNANQLTLQDGIAPVTNQYLWQPLAGAFYAACTDGAYDMAVVAHEYGHAISNRMIAGPDTGTGATQGQTESWSDLIFSEYFRGKGISTGPGANPFALAPYVSGNKQRGIRNYGMNDSPLNYSDLEYDGNGTTSPHADGEIWSATNFDIAEALNDKYDATYPSSDEALQLKCAKGKLPSTECPGNRRWAQIMFDGFLLNPTNSTMLDSRDAMLAADRLRFNGRNQGVLWREFAQRGMGETASSTGADDREPVPGWSSPLQDDEATVTFRSTAAETTVYTGDYEARISPTADTDPETATARRVRFVPGTYRFVAQAPGAGEVRFTRTLKPGQQVTVDVPVRHNYASSHNGATATGDGTNLGSLIDDTEETNWASLESAGTASEGKGEGRQVEGRQVTVRLGDEPVRINRVNVSAALRPTDADNAGDPGSQSRFSALRSFEILVCDATVQGNTCTDDPSEFRVAYRSANDAFPGVRPRPTAPDLALRSFRFAGVDATHVQIRVRDNQCTGGPLYQGAANPSNDPVFSNPDCDSEEQTPDRAVLTPPSDMVRIAELQVFGPQQ